MHHQILFPTVYTALFASVGAHMVIREPTPYMVSPERNGASTYPSTSPLSGGQYPCQFGATGPYNQNGTTVAAGSSISLAFTGSAQHGGGSCQVSLFNLGSASTVSTNPNDWKVIHTILGGCPGTGATATSNGSDPAGRPDGAHCTNNNQTDCSRTFTIPFSNQLPSGNFVFAWSWFNKIGNREMYMNCAPIKLTGGASNDSYLQSLPAMFIANIPEAGCTTVETYSPLLPNPGNSVEVFDSPDDNVSVLGLGTCKAAAGSSALTTLPAQSSNPYPTPSFTTLTIGSTDTVIQSYPSSIAGATSSTQCENPCSPNGILICLPNNTFGLCDHGCAIAEPLAAGTTCSNGQIQKRRPHVGSRRVRF